MFAVDCLHRLGTDCEHAELDEDGCLARSKSRKEE
jgi:hypothetical protein